MLFIFLFSGFMFGIFVSNVLAAHCGGTCGGFTCYPSEYCIGTGSDPHCGDPDNSCPHPTPTKTPTPTTEPCGGNNQKCCPPSNTCNSGYVCNHTDNYCDPAPSNTPVPTKTPTPKPPTSTPTKTPIPTPTLIPPTPTPTPTSVPYYISQPNLTLKLNKTFNFEENKITVTRITPDKLTLNIQLPISRNFRKITSDSSYEYHPAIYENKIVWVDFENDINMVYLYDLATKQFVVISSSYSYKRNPDIDSRGIVWLDNGRIFFYDIKSRLTREIISSANNIWWSLDISGDKIVYVSNSNGPSYLDVYTYDLTRQTEIPLVVHGIQQYPSISGDKIVWEDFRNGPSEVFLYDISLGREKQLTNDIKNQYRPKIYGNLVVWAEENGFKSDILLYDISSNTKQIIASSVDLDTYPVIYENKITWSERNATSYKHIIYLYNISTKEKIPIFKSRTSKQDVGISRQGIVWQQSSLNYNEGSDIYFHDFPNQPPILDTIGDKTITEGQTLSFQLTGIDPDGDPITFSAGGPSGSFFDTSTNTFTWKPNYSQAGSYTAVFNISDGELSDSETITIVVKNAILPTPTLQNTPPILTILDPDVNNSGWVLGDDISLVNSAFGAVRGDSRYKQELDLDNSGRILSADISLVNNAFGLTWMPTNLKEGKTLTFYVMGVDADRDTLIFSTTNLPEGATFDSSTGRFSWTPSSTQSGNYYIIFKVSDGKSEDAEILPITVIHVP